MIKFLTFLCFTIYSFSFSFASTLNDESEKLKRLRLQATDYFEAGELENERLTLIEILVLRQDFETLSLAVQSCIICEKFEAAKYLLETCSHSLKPFQIKNLRDYFQDEKIKLENSKKDFKAEEQEEIFELKTDNKGQVVTSFKLQVRLSLLNLLTKEYFRKGDREQERLTLIEIAKIKKDPPSFKRALEQCVVCEQFNEGNALLDNAKGYFSITEFQTLGDYFQEQETRYRQRTTICVVSTKKK